jgi:hypothetical protein
MTNERDQNDNPPIDESTYAASGSEAGGQYNQDGPTIANAEGDTMSGQEDEGARSPDEAPEG